MLCSKVCVRSKRSNRCGLKAFPMHVLQRKLARPNSQRFSYITYALQQRLLDRRGTPFDEDRSVVSGAVAGGNANCRQTDRRPKADRCSGEVLRTAKEYALSDRRHLLSDRRRPRPRFASTGKISGIAPVFKRVDTCGAEFESFTPYLYSTYEEECEAEPTDRRKIMILGSGPNRIGQGIEFDYCCCHASFALRDAGFETIMVNCNPETVSTDYDTSDRLYFEPLTFEDVMNIVDVEKPEGVIVQFGGQTPLNLAGRLARSGRADHRDFARFDRPGRGPQAIRRIAGGTEDSAARKMARRSRRTKPKISQIRSVIRLLCVRALCSAGGRWRSFMTTQSLDEYMRIGGGRFAGKTDLDRSNFLERAAEIDVDALADEDGGRDRRDSGAYRRGRAFIRAIRRACCRPQKIAAEHLETIQPLHAAAWPVRSRSRGLMNIQFAIKDDRVYVLEVNPRASRTVPFVAKATGVPIAKIASLVMAGESTLAEFGLPEVLAGADGCSLNRRFSRSKSLPASTRSLAPKCIRRAR